MGVRSFALYCLALSPSAALASSLDSTSCNAPWQPFGSGECPAPAEIDINNYVSNETTVTPIRNPTVDRNDYAHLVPSIAASLFYSDAKGTEQLAAVLNFTMNYPTVIVENSAYVSGCKCTDSSIVTLVFSDKQAFSYTQQWPTSDFVLITDAPGCSSQPDERGVYLVSSMTSNPLRQSVICRASPKRWEDVSDTLEIGFGRTGQAGKSGKNAQAETRTATRYWTADGELTSSTYFTTMIPARFTKTTTASSLRSTSLGYYHRPQQHNATQPAWRGPSPTLSSADPSSKNPGSSARSSQSQTSRVASSSSSPFSSATNSSTSSNARKTRSGSTSAYSISSTTSSLSNSGPLSSYSTSTGEPSSSYPSEGFSSTKTSFDHLSSTTTTSSGQSSVTSETSSAVMSSMLTTTSESLSTTTSTMSESTSTTSTTDTSPTNASTSASSSSITSTTATSTASSTAESTSTSSSAAESTSATSTSTTSTSTTSTSTTSTSTTSTSTTSASSSSTTSTTVTSTTSSAAESTSSTSTDSTSSTSVLTTSSTTTMSTAGMYANSTSSTSATATTSADDSLATLSPRAREIYNEIMSVVTINEDGYMVVPLPDDLAKQSGQAETAPFDPWNEEDQLRWQQEMIDLGFSFGEDILNEVTASLATAAGQEFTTMPDAIFTDTELEGYVRSEMIDRASLPEDAWEENSWELNAEVPLDFVEGEEDVDEGGEDDGGRGRDRLPSSAEDEIDQNEEKIGEEEEREIRAKRTKRYSSRPTTQSLNKRNDDDDWWDYVSGFAWNYLGFLGDMGCDVCSIASKAKGLFDDLSALKEAMEEVRSRQPALAEGSWDGSLYINVPAQTLVETWDGPELSCSDASIQVSSLLIEAKMVVSLKDQRVVMGEVVTSLTSKSNLQFQFQSRDSIEGWWTFTTSTLNLDTIEAPGIFKISPRFYYNFGARYWFHGTGTIEAGATTEVTNAKATIDIVDKKVKDGYSNWKPSNINLKYPTLQSWQAASIEPYYRSSLVIDLDVFGNRYSDAVVLNQETWIGYSQGRVFMTESRQCQRRDMKLVATARTTNTISVMGGEKTDLFSDNWDIAARCFTPAGQRPLCPAGVYDGQILDLVTDSETGKTHRYKITCGEAIVHDGAWDHLYGYQAAFPYTIEECMQECADLYGPIYWTIPSMPGCKVASWNPSEADFLPGCSWLTSKNLKTIKGYEMAIAKQVEWWEEGIGTFEPTIPPDT